ncbi:MAG TPA: hypothetical protein DD979_14185 [Gammaproteobacteria bacterium]|nr:hypothetical protein [Gammaproteobacteria bacterium]
MKSIRQHLALATCTLLSQHAGANAFENDWEVDSSLLSYQEADDRVSVTKWIGDVQGKVSDNDTVRLKLVHDTMSGASPTGAVRSNNESVTFTSASGNSGFSTGSAGGGSMAEFEDSRLGVNADWTHAWNSHTRTQYAASISSENDYESLGGGLTVERDNANRQTTYSAGLGLTNDSIFRSGGNDTPEPLASTATSQSLGKGERTSWDAIVGVSHILNRRTVGQVNLSYARSSGYHTDPYKVISATDGVGNIVDTYHEHRPGERSRMSLYSKLAHKLNQSNNTLHTSYRLYQDDWNIRSHTLDAKFHMDFGKQRFLEPHARLYKQTAAEFYQHHLGVDENVNVLVPEDGYVSADYRLDRFWSYAVGLKYGLPVGADGSLRLRAEYMAQTFAHSEFDTNTAVIMQASYKYVFQ